ncbi:kinesin-like protein KIF22 isoform X1 [Haliotis rufescens]|uniref:kinesin-like protein KIF22 isoform X1 n=2 Tax=Haliotis rufescens TaxID=6454 RepID=UPI00201F504B|nr:kinesin-like protein KIF22 isoform X1 [Haliotis rufescens]
MISNKYCDWLKEHREPFSKQFINKIVEIMDKKQTKVKVVIRVRPSLKEDAKMCVSAGTDSVEIFNHRNIKENIKYDFSSVYDSSSSQQLIYNECIKNLLHRSLDGENVSIFAYGPTGAGKTYTMLGSPADPGVIPRVINGLFQTIGRKTKDMGAQPHSYKFEVAFSYLEIYNEKVQDLLEPRNCDLPIREDGNHNIFVAGLAEKTIQNFDEFKNLFGPASNNRTVAATKLNDRSSRSHSILMLKVRKTQQCAPFREYQGKIYLIDLAGSEDNRRTGNKGIRLKESGAINKSLFSLGEVVDAINSGLPRIPYRNSKLTRLLQDSIGGSCHSIMITNIAPEEHYYYDTYCTLNFASKSKKIVNTNTMCVKEAPVVSAVSHQSKLKRSNSAPLHTVGKKAKLSPSSPPVSAEAPVSSDPAPLLSPLMRRQKNLEQTVNSRLQEMEQNILRHIQQVAAQSTNTSQRAPVSMETIHKQLSAFQDQLKQLGQSTTKTNKAIDSTTDEERGRKETERRPMRDTTNQQHKMKVGKKRSVKDGDDITCSPLFIDPPRLFKKGFKSTGSKRNIFEEDDIAETKALERLAENKGPAHLLNTEAQRKHNAEFLHLLNSSSAKELQQLHTVGNKRARLIFEWRELHGLFTKIQDLRGIPGFTEKYVQNLLHSNMVSLAV